MAPFICFFCCVCPARIRLLSCSHFRGVFFLSLCFKLRNAHIHLSSMKHRWTAVAPQRTFPSVAYMTRSNNYRSVPYPFRLLLRLLLCPSSSCGRCAAIVLDATKDELPSCFSEDGGVDMILLQFSISAVSPKDMEKVAQLVERALKPGGKLFIRDYGR